MKKHFLMIMALCLLVLPSKANDLADELCANEVFVAMVKQCDELSKHLLSLNETQRGKYLVSEEFNCFQESFLSNRAYLAETFNLFDRTESQAAVRIAIKKMVTDPAVCEWYFQIAYFNCFNIPDPWTRQNCINAAIAGYNQCMGIPIEA